VAKFKPWLKMWVEWIDDIKILELTLAEQGTWWRLCTLAQKCAADGALVRDDGAPLSLDEIADILRIKAGDDRKALASMIQKMTTQGSLRWNSKTLFVIHFAERQAKTSSETPEAVRDRQRRFREKLADVTEKPLQNETQKRERIKEKKYIEGEGEAEAECHALRNGRYSVTCNGNPVTFEPALAKIANLHEEYFGIITPILSEKFKSFVENFSGPVGWVDLAFAEAVKYKNRRWQYVEAILYRWQEKGGPHADRRGDDTHQRDSSGGDGFGGFGGFRAIESGPDEPDGGDED